MGQYKRGEKYSHKAVKFIDSEIRKIEPIYLTDDWKLMEHKLLGPDELVKDFEPLEQWDEEQLRVLSRKRFVYEDRQKEYGILYYKPYESRLRPGFYPQDEFHRSDKKVRLVLGGNQCLDGDSEIWDPSDCVFRKVRDIDKEFFVNAWDGEKVVTTKALRPFEKEVDDLYEITLSNGNKFTSSLGHRVLTPCFGYASVYELLVKYGGVLLGTSSGPCQSAHVLDGQSSLKRVGDLKCDCSSYLHQYDVQPQLGVNIVQDVVPLRDDVEEHNFYAFLRKGVYADIGECIRLYQQKFHPSNQDVLRHYEGLYAGILSDASCKPYKSTLDLSGDENQSRHEFYHQESKNEFAQQDKTFCSTKPFESPLISNTTELVVTSIVYKKTDVKWDFEVPKYHNYILAGAVHHNSGKTNSGAAEALWLSFGMHPYHNIRIPNKGRIVGADLDKGIMEVIWPKYESLMPKSELSSEPRKYSGGQIKKLNYKCGSSVEFLSYEQDTKLFEGWTGDWVWFDEPPPRDIYIACYRGLMRYGGMIFITATPLNEPWIYDELFLKAGSGADQPSVFSLPTRGNPHLTLEQIKLYEETIPEDERPARLDGVFKHLSGLVYKEFSEVHRIPDFDIPKEWSRYMVMDFHQREPCAILWAAVDPKGTLYFYDELKIDKTIFEIAEAIMLKEKQEYGRPVPTRWIDSIAATPDRATGKSALKEFRQAGDKLKWPLAFRSSTKNHAAGFKAVHEYLHIKNGAPGCYFLEKSVPYAISSMLHYQWDEWSGGKEKTKGGSAAHFADDIRYICVMNPGFKQAMPGQDDVINEEINNPEAVTGYRGG